MKLLWQQLHMFLLIGALQKSQSLPIISSYLHKNSLSIMVTKIFKILLCAYDFYNIFNVETKN